MARIAYTVKQIGVGTPDFSPVKPAGQITPGATYTLTDLGELAARLGSPVTFDRRGNVVWYDDFESNINKWFIRFAGEGPGFTALGVGGGAVLSAEAAYRGSLAAKLTTPDVLGDNTRLIAILPLSTITTLGFEVTFTLDPNIYTFGIRIHRFDGTDYIGGAIEYNRLWDPVAGVRIGHLQYWTSAYVIEDLIAPLALGSAPYGAGSYQWHTLKLVIDIENRKYRRCIINNQAVDMVADLFTIADAAAPHTYFEIVVTSVVAGNQSIFVGNAIMTQNEPLIVPATV